jgi:1-piperideine-2-carboxylate/1-pyrroline-2-carboxylate reductase [NAD(P)H]
VGSFSPDAAEIDAATVRGSRLYVDDPVGARAEAGDLIRAGVDWTQVQALAAALEAGGPAQGPVLLKTVGNAAWDLAAARVAVRSAGA